MQFTGVFVSLIKLNYRQYDGEKSVFELPKYLTFSSWGLSYSGIFQWNLFLLEKNKSKPFSFARNLILGSKEEKAGKRRSSETARSVLKRLV